MLAAAGIPHDFAVSLGVRSVVEAAGLPESLRHHAFRRPFPALLFPWRSPDGTVDFQLRPDVPVGVDGEPSKYLQAAGVRLLNVLGDASTASAVWIVEGSKQCLAARAWAPPDVLVIGVPGCWNAMKDQALLPGLAELVEDRPVVLVFDADMTANPAVWQAADSLGQALDLEGAEVRYALLPGGGKQGLDDLLGQRDASRRPKFLRRLMDKAVAELPRRPEDSLNAVHPDRPAIDVKRDRLIVVDEITDLLSARWSGWRLFDHGDAISELLGQRLRAVDKGHFRNLLIETALFYTPSRGGATPCWPDSGVIEAVAARYGRFPRLERVTATPFLRPDGTVCQSVGYDETTQTFLVEQPDLGPVDVPDDPDAAQVEAAVQLLLDDWLGDIPFATTADGRTSSR